jgi:hypothetical protein
MGKRPPYSQCWSRSADRFESPRPAGRPRVTDCVLRCWLEGRATSTPVDKAGITFRGPDSGIGVELGLGQASAWGGGALLRAVTGVDAVVAFGKVAGPKASMAPSLVAWVARDDPAALRHDAAMLRCTAGHSDARRCPAAQGGGWRCQAALHGE